MVEHAALYFDPADPLVIRVVLDDWQPIAELDNSATGRGTGRARHGRAESASSCSGSSGLHASPPAPFTPADAAGVAHGEQGRAT